MDNNFNKVKQVIVMRKDLNMRKGKMVAQGAHASMKAVHDQGSRINGEFVIPLSADMENWLMGQFTKVCVSVDSELELCQLYTTAVHMGLPCAMIEDSGLTEFNGVITKTAIAIGPAASSEIDKITGQLKLL